MSFVSISVGTWVAIGSAAVSAAGAYVAYDAQQEAADVAEATGKYNAQMQRNQAKEDTMVAEENARRKARENASFLAGQRAALAASGLSMEGTPLAVLGDTLTTLERDIMDLSFDAQRQNRANLFGADFTELAGANTATGIRNEATGQLISSMGKTATSYAQTKGYLQ